MLVVDKNFSGWAGQANKGAGVFMFLGPDDPVDQFLDYHTRNIGMFLEDQLLLGEFAAESRDTIEKLDSGVTRSAAMPTEASPPIISSPASLGGWPPPNWTHR